jgi:xylan 1,4-beta-xylosidase
MFRFASVVTRSVLFGSLLAVLPLAAQTSSTAIRLSAAASDPGKPLVHFWSKVVGAGRANEGLRSTWQEQLATSHREAGFNYVRFHGLFHDDMMVYREDEQGRPIYNFQYIDDLFDRMLDQGVRPFVELGFMPGDLATKKNTTMWWQANGCPPKDYDKWAALVRVSVQHWEQRYGADEVRRWYFEVWNEPNLKGFWAGDQQQYYALYKITAVTIKQVDPALKVGGPATSNYDIDEDVLKAAQAAAKASGKPIDPLSLPWTPIWVEDFLNWAKQNNLPVDFVSTHPYPSWFGLPGVKPTENHLYRSVNAIRDDLTTLRKIVDESPYPKAEIHLTEWNTSWEIFDYTHDALSAAAFVVKSNLDSIGLVDSLSYWTFTDVFEENRKTESPFHGCFGMINYQQIPKPVFHAYRMMNQLGDRLLAQTDGAIVTRDAAMGRVTAMAWNNPPERKTTVPVTPTVEAALAFDATGSARDLDLHLTGLTPGATFELETLDRTHGNVLPVWDAMGRPDSLTRPQTETLRAVAAATAKEILHADAQGQFELHRPIASWSVVLLRQF